MKRHELVIDVVFLAGLLLVAVGAGLVYLPAGVMIGGLELAGVAYVAGMR